MLDAAALHGHDLDVAADPLGRVDLQVAELDVLAGDVAAYALAYGAVGRLGGQLVEFGLPDIGVFRQQLVQLLAVHGHAGILDADPVLLERLDGIAHGLAVAHQAVFRGQVDFDQFDIQAGFYKLFDDFLEGDLGHFIAVQDHQGFGYLNFACHTLSPAAFKNSKRYAQKQNYESPTLVCR